MRRKFFKILRACHCVLQEGASKEKKKKSGGNKYLCYFAFNTSPRHYTKGPKKNRFLRLAGSFPFLYDAHHLYMLARRLVSQKQRGAFSFSQPSCMCVFGYFGPIYCTYTRVHVCIPGEIFQWDAWYFTFYKHQHTHISRGSSL